MRLRHSLLISGALAGLALAIAIPVVGQDRPESILPPGFGDGDDSKPAKQTDTPKPRSTDLLPDIGIAPPSPSSSSSDSGSSASSSEDEPDDEDEESEDDELTVTYDIPPSARRSTAIIGALGPGDGDMGVNAFQGSGGQYLEKLMRGLREPIASRWASIVLRRALLSNSQTPPNVSGPDWAAERAWLLLRMGEADSARLLVQAVDADLYTPKMSQVALQSALAASDPTMACGFTDSAGRQLKEPAWTAMSAVCTGLAGEGAFAGALLDRARASKAGQEIDYLLAEKVQGASSAARRTVEIQWDGVTHLSAWRYGLATATGVEIPEKLLGTVGPQVRLWRARAPLVPFERRAIDSELAAASGVLSSSALVDFYGAWLDSTDPAERSGKPFNALRDAYVAESVSDRISAMRSLWTISEDSHRRRYARLVLTARAAANVPVTSDSLGDAETLIASMLSAGLDLQAARWEQLVADDGSNGAWGLLAVGSPSGKLIDSASRIEDVGDDASSNGELKSRFLFAGLAGLGRIAPNEVGAIAEQLGVPLGKQTPWVRALEKAVADQAPATVALLCAIGLQADRWTDVPPSHLFHVVSALRRAGYEGEARMIAAEALMRV